MTREDLYDWLTVHKCTVEPLPTNTKGNAIKMFNPSTNRYAYIDTPINDKPVNDYTVCKICFILGVECPDECSHMKPLTTFIKNKHYPDF